MNEVNFEHLLESALAQLPDLAIKESELTTCARFLEVIWDENRHINLFSRKMQAEALVVDHLVDSLLLLPFLPDVKVVADLGTGGGFPAVPLAICRPQVTWLLYEKSTLKRRYLQGLAEVMPQLDVCGKLEDFGIDDDVDLITSRAFKPIAETLRLTQDFLKQKGQYMLFKARRERIDQELSDASSLLKGHAVEVQAIKSPINQAERHIVWINKK